MKRRSPGWRIAVGDTVWLKELQVSARVLAVMGESGEAEVQVGQSRVRLGLYELEEAGDGAR